MLVDKVDYLSKGYCVETALLLLSFANIIANCVYADEAPL